ncbi:unnamed protein product [Pleuronectes platessa]|uniref:Uncharacterized protein n=1 Tax=Pleuronectes platessa TaxID=8262 RepID=A0A9N7Z6F5_PLEPL|nr:unnamed protein product [Pleuronectes platessa]
MDKFLIRKSQATGAPVAKKPKLCKYDESYLQFGFTVTGTTEQRPQCVLCAKRSFDDEILKRSLLTRKTGDPQGPRLLLSILHILKPKEDADDGDADAEDEGDAEDDDDDEDEDGFALDGMKVGECLFWLILLVPSPDKRGGLDVELAMPPHLTVRRTSSCAAHHPAPHMILAQIIVRRTSS